MKPFRVGSLSWFGMVVTANGIAVACLWWAMRLTPGSPERVFAAGLALMFGFLPIGVTLPQLPQRGAA